MNVEILEQSLITAVIGKKDHVRIGKTVLEVEISLHLIWPINIDSCYDSKNLNVINNYFNQYCKLWLWIFHSCQNNIGYIYGEYHSYSGHQGVGPRSRFRIAAFASKINVHEKNLLALAFTNIAEDSHEPYLTFTLIAFQA